MPHSDKHRVNLQGVSVVQNAGCAATIEDDPIDGAFNERCAACRHHGLCEQIRGNLRGCLGRAELTVSGGILTQPTRCGSRLKAAQIAPRTACDTKRLNLSIPQIDIDRSIQFRMEREATSRQRIDEVLSPMEQVGLREPFVGKSI